MTKRVTYWICTALLALVFFSGGVMQVLGSHDATQAIVTLGYPVYSVVLIGAWKALGALAILVPGLPRVKEWAYAGILFDLTGAVVSHAVMHSEPHHVVVPTVLSALALASWALRPAERRLAAAT